MNQLGQGWWATCRGRRSWDGWPPEVTFAPVRGSAKYVTLAFILTHEHIFLLPASERIFFPYFLWHKLWII